MSVIWWWILLFCQGLLRNEPMIELHGKAQGTTWMIRYAGTSDQLKPQELDSFFHAIDQSLSSYEPQSLISQFNRDGRVRMDKHLYLVVATALQVYQESDGAFDITTAGLSALWGFGPANARNNNKAIPSAAAIRRQLHRTGSDKLLIRNDSLIAMCEGLTIDVNGLAQGYTVDALGAFLQSKGIAQMLVELGGEVKVVGVHPATGFWTIGLEKPTPSMGEWYPVGYRIQMNDEAVTTSGGYRNYRTYRQKRYSHVIDPLSGRPVDNGVISVTVVASNAMIADAWDNALMVWGIEKAMDWINIRKNLDVMISYIDSRGHLRDTSSTGFQKRIN